MPKGRTSSLRLTLTPLQRQTLEAWQQAPGVPAGRARRARLLLRVADGLSVTRVAETAGISRRHVYRWVRRFQAHGLQGLYDRSRRAFAHRRWAREETPPDRGPGQA